MKILYIGDIMGPPGIEVVKRVLPELHNSHQPDLVIAQAENVTEGRGFSVKDFKLLQSYGIDFFTGGNWTTFRSEIHSYLSDDTKPVIRPANYPKDYPGKGAKYVQTGQGPVLVVSLLGQIVGKDADRPVDNPLSTIDHILNDNKHVKCVGTIVNFHGDFSSEKVVIGYYLDGQVTAVVGDHWHVPTADAMILPKGTAHISDVGMCGTLHSSLGVELDTIIARWRDRKVLPNKLESKGPLQFNSVLIESDNGTGLAKSIQPIRKIVD